MNEYLNISQIENYLVGLLKPLSKNVFAASLPTTLKDGYEDMILVDCGDNVNNDSEYGRSFGSALVNIFLFAKPNSNGKKNVKRFNQLENAINDIIENTHHKHYTITELYRSQDYDTNIDYHFIVVAIKLIIH